MGIIRCCRCGFTANDGWLGSTVARQWFGFEDALRCELDLRISKVLRQVVLRWHTVASCPPMSGSPSSSDSISRASSRASLPIGSYDVAVAVYHAQKSAMTSATNDTYI